MFYVRESFPIILSKIPPLILLVLGCLDKAPNKFCFPNSSIDKSTENILGIFIFVYFKKIYFEVIKISYRTIKFHKNGIFHIITWIFNTNIELYNI